MRVSPEHNRDIAYSDSQQYVSLHKMGIRLYQLTCNAKIGEGKFLKLLGEELQEFNSF